MARVSDMLISSDPTEPLEDDFTAMNLDNSDNESNASNEALASDSEHTNPSPRESSYDILAIKNVYHQGHVSADDPSSCRWGLPVAPEPYNGRIDRLKLSEQHPIIKKYSQSCGLLTSRWKCEVEDAVPVALRDYTPYSFAMLFMLRRLSCSTSKNFQLAQSFLMRAFVNRTAKHEATRSKNNLVATKFSHKWGESKVVESTQGLMLADVSIAISWGKEAKRARKQAAKSQASASRPHDLQLAQTRQNLLPEQVLSTARADNIPRRKRLTRAQRAEARQVRLEAHRKRSPNVSPVAHNVSNSVGEGNAAPKAQEAPQVSAKQTANDGRFVDRNINNVLREIDLNGGSQGPKTKKLRRLRAGGFLRNSHNVSLPSEKSNISSLPLLPSMSATASKEVMDQLGQLPLPQSKPQYTLMWGIQSGQQCEMEDD